MNDWQPSLLGWLFLGCKTGDDDLFKKLAMSCLYFQTLTTKKFEEQCGPFFNFRRNFCQLSCTSLSFGVKFLLKSPSTFFLFVGDIYCFFMGVEGRHLRKKHCVSDWIAQMVERQIMTQVGISPPPSVSVTCIDGDE